MKPSLQRLGGTETVARAGTPKARRGINRRRILGDLPKTPKFGPLGISVGIVFNFLGPVGRSRRTYENTQMTKGSWCSAKYITNTMNSLDNLTYTSPISPSTTILWSFGYFRRFYGIYPQDLNPGRLTLTRYRSRGSLRGETLASRLRLPPRL